MSGLVCKSAQHLKRGEKGKKLGTREMLPFFQQRTLGKEGEKTTQTQIQALK